MTESSDNLIFHLSLMSLTKSLPRKVTMSLVSDPSLYLGFIPCKKATRFVSVRGTSIVTSPFPYRYAIPATASEVIALPLSD
jgi:hypothetical protein